MRPEFNTKMVVYLAIVLVFITGSIIRGQTVNTGLEVLNIQCPGCQTVSTF